MKTKRYNKALSSGAGLAAFLALGGALLSGCGGGGDSGTADTSASGTKTASGGSDDPADAPASTPSSGALSGAMSGGTATAGAAGGGAAATPASPVKPTQVAMKAPRKDPFYVPFRRLPPPRNVFEEVEPTRLASVDIPLPPQDNTVVRELPSRRVSGIVSGEGVFAILEGQGDPEIVKPGMKTRDGYEVVSITGDMVRLRRKEGNVTLMQDVMLSDLPPGAAGPSGGMMPGGMSGMMPGGGFGGGTGRRPPIGGGGGGKGDE